MSSTWHPQEPFLTNLCAVLEESTRAIGQRQMALTQKLEEWRSVPDFPLYLAYTFSHPNLNAMSPSGRIMSGLLLKNNLLRMDPSLDVSSASPFYSQFELIRSALLASLSDNETGIRNTSGSLISAMVAHFGLASWPGLLEALASRISTDSAQILVAESSLSAISKICEDAAYDLVLKFPHVVEHFIASLLKWIHAFPPKQAHYAIHALNQFIPHRPTGFQAHLSQYVGLLSQKANEESHASGATNASPFLISKLVCRALVLLFENYIQDMLPNIAGVLEYTLSVLGSPDPELALEAAEFWLSISHQAPSIDPQLLERLFPNLLPCLLKCMVYDPEDPVYIQNASESASRRAESQADIRPRHHKEKNPFSESTARGASRSKSTAVEEGEMEEGTTDSDFDSTLTDDEDDDEAGEWNLRKCAAATLDSFSSYFSATQMSDMLFPIVFAYMKSEEWTAREAGVLAMGAVAEGARRVGWESTHLSQIIPFLIQQLSHRRPLVRSISCWTLGRYVEWIVQQFYSGSHEPFELTMKAILDACHDMNERAQGTALVALSSLVEASQGAVLLSYLDPIVSCMGSLFPHISKKNYLVLLNTLSSLSSTVGRQLNQPTWFSALLPPLASRLNETHDDDSFLFPLLETIANCILSFGPELCRSCLPPLYDRAIRLLTLTLPPESSGNLADSGDEMDPFEEDLCVAALELLSSLTQLCSSDHWISMTQAHPVPFATLYYRALTHTSSSIRQSAFALYGDLCLACPIFLSGHYSKLHSVFMANLVPSPVSESEDREPSVTVSVANNAAWAIGEFALMSGKEVEPYVEAYLRTLCSLIVRRDYPESYLNNVAVAMGRLARVSPSSSFPYLIPILPAWSHSMSTVHEPKEKESAFAGICATLLAHSPTLWIQYAPLVSAMIAGYGLRPSHDIKPCFVQLLESIKNALGSLEWHHLCSRLHPEAMAILKSEYSIQN